LSLSHISADWLWPRISFRQPISANVRERQPGPLMQLLYRTQYRFRLLSNRILSALYSNISMIRIQNPGTPKLRRFMRSCTRYSRPITAFVKRTALNYKYRRTFPRYAAIITVHDCTWQ